MPVLQLELPDLSATETLGSLLADGLAAGDVISLSGPLGAVQANRHWRGRLFRRQIRLKPMCQAPPLRLFKPMSLGMERRFGILIFTGLKALKTQCSLGWMMRLSMRFV